MSARDDVLDGVRRALAGADRSQHDVSRGYRSHPPADGLVELFVERVEDYRASVSRCSPTGVADRVLSVLPDGGSVIVPDCLDFAVPGAVRDTGQGPLDLDAIDAVVTQASLGIAETGTIVLEHGPGQGRRALSLVPDVHVCVVDQRQIVAGVPEAVAALDPRRPQTWISGPSATSDIELTRVEGVHGPRTLHVVLVER